RAAPARARVVVVARVGGERPHDRGDEQARERGEQRPESKPRDQLLERGAAGEAIRVGPTADATGAEDEVSEERHRHDLLAAVSVKPKAIAAASSRSASRVVGRSSSSETWAPLSRCGSQGTRTQARQREAKCASIRSTSTSPRSARTPFRTATAEETTAVWPCSSSQSSVELAARAPSSPVGLT